jgi:hypothetical protein
MRPPRSSACAWRAVTTAIALAVAPLSVGGVAAAAPPAAHAPPGDPVAVHVANAAQRFGIPELWIWAVMRIESAGHARAVSPAGAMGLMQIMPSTWTTMRVRYGLGADPYDPRDNIMAGAAFLREMHDRYGEPGFLAAYNAGPGRYDDYLFRGRALPAETVAYVGQLAPIIGGSGGLSGAMIVRPDLLAWTRSALFASHWTGASMAQASDADPVTYAPPDRSARVTPSTVQPASNGLFVPVSSRATP